MNLTARLARWSADHWKTVVFGWLLLVVALVFIAGSVGTNAMDEIDEMTGDSKVGQQLLAAAGLTTDSSEIVIITAPGAATSTQAEALARRVAAHAEELPGLDNVRWQGEGTVAPDGDARIVTFDVTAAEDDALARVEPMRTFVADLDDAAPGGVRVQQFGDITINDDIGTMVGEDLARSELLTAPITLVILLLTFGALIAAGLPLVIGAVSVVAALSLGSLLSHLLPQSEFAPNLVTMLGLALGIDYTLFLLRREREERAKGATPRQALLRAAATSGTAVVVSGITVIVALSGLLASGSGMFVSMGIASMLVVAMVLLASLLVVPAVLGRLGDGIERGRLPRFGARAKRRATERAARRAARRGVVWGALVRRSVRRPVLTIVLVGGVLVVAALPVLDMRTGDSTTASLPDGSASIAALTEFERHFPGGAEPGRLVVRDDAANPTPGRLDAAISSLERAADTAGLLSGPIEQQRGDDDRTTLVTLPLAGADDRAASDRAVVKLRALVDDTIAAEPDTTVALTGSAASSYDFAHGMSERLPLVFLVVLGSAFVLLACAFRSIVVPLVAIVLNLLSVGVAYGFLVWGFQQGNMGSILPVAGDGVVVSWMPLFLFALLFGLSMDYHVFLLSRIREHVLAGFTTRDAVVRGVQESASTISSAALIMVGVFAAFATSQLAEMQQMGAGLAVAILIDATVIRAFLLPAIMSLLGGANWYLPNWLGWLPRIAMEGRTLPSPNAVVEPAA